MKAILTPTEETAPRPHYAIVLKVFSCEKNPDKQKTFKLEKIKTKVSPFSKLSSANIHLNNLGVLCIHHGLREIFSQWILTWKTFLVLIMWLWS